MCACVSAFFVSLINYVCVCFVSLLIEKYTQLSPVNLPIFFKINSNQVSLSSVFYYFCFFQFIYNLIVLKIMSFYLIVANIICLLNIYTYIYKHIFFVSCFLSLLFRLVSFFDESLTSEVEHRPPTSIL